MADSVSQGRAQNPRNRQSGKRISLACLPCRTKHIRCDGSKPICNRCSEDDRECNYTSSRRGGLDRAALAARRQRNATSDPSSSTSPSRNSNWDILSSSGPTDTPETHNSLNSSHSLDDILFSAPLNTRLVDVGSDPFIDRYYDCFHKFHPFILPRKRCALYMKDSSKANRMKPVISAVLFIGSLYSRSSQSSTLKQEAAEAIAEAQQQMPSEPFLAQAQLLYSVALFWCGDKEDARKYLDDAVSLAVDLGMSKREFATAYGEGDAILEESWRRTWWQIYLVDACYFHIQKSSPFPSRDVPATTGLPCEEFEYELGDIPPPASLDDYETREFCTDGRKYSSFAHLIGLFRGTMQVLATNHSNMERYPPMSVVEALDAVSDGWLRLLPERKRRVMSEDGEIDELAFFALLALHAALVTIHRPYSSLQYNPLEQISSCSRLPFPSPKSGNQQDIHTTRCFVSIEAQVRLIMLPKQTFCHSPFVICMVTTGIIPFLSACKFVLSGKKLALARDQIRLSIGCLKSLADIWPKGSKSVKEIQEIAQEVLGLKQNQRTAIVDPTSMAASGETSTWSEDLRTSSDDSFLENMGFLDPMADFPACWDMATAPMQPFTS